MHHFLQLHEQAPMLKLALDKLQQLLYSSTSRSFACC